MSNTKEKPVTFDPVAHKYFLTGTDKRLISSTQLIHKFVNPFDPTGEITRKYALKHNKTVQEVIEMWRVINEESCTYGTNVHTEMEEYINTGEVRESEYKDYVEQFKAYREANIKGKLFSEVMVYSIEEMVAGMVDLIEKVENNTINIYDFKTNKELKFKSFGGEKMKYGLWYLEDCNFNHYQIQLSLYAYLCELKGLTVGTLTILYINPKTQLLETHAVRYMRNEVLEILEKKKDFIY